ncbi:MAG: hypothetical protein U9R50_02795 [Campylobacterota bacterium]|nr:hypothetical protein [Campylobacterota bacterium]
MQSKKAMMTIEVLIALVIIFLAIVMNTTAVKFFNMTYAKKDQYINFYTTALSIKDNIASEICYQNMKIEGQLNNFTYQATCTLNNEIPNFLKAADIDEVSGHTGPYMMQLFYVSLELKNKNFIKSLTYYITKAKKIK